MPDYTTEQQLHNTSCGREVTSPSSSYRYPIVGWKGEQHLAKSPPCLQCDVSVCCALVCHWIRIMGAAGDDELKGRGGGDSLLCTYSW